MNRLRVFARRLGITIRNVNIVVIKQDLELAVLITEQRQVMLTTSNLSALGWRQQFAAVLLRPGALLLARVDPVNLARLDGKRLLFRRAILVGKRNLNLVAVVGIKPHDRYLMRGLVSFNRVGNRCVIRLADNRVSYLSSLIRLKDHQGRQWRGAVWINLDVGIIQRPRSTFDDFGIALGLLGCRIILK